VVIMMKDLLPGVFWFIAGALMISGAWEMGSTECAGLVCFVLAGQHYVVLLLREEK